ncbi:hypothetical protein FACS189473_0680 [Spirochaetia bacterium]|nr:hypothetical protein FACS189473_0680 [Spirochaetia bacterium]
MYLMDVLLDAGAIMATVLNEPNRDIVVNLTKEATLLSPEMISFEIGNALVSLFKRHKLNEAEVLNTALKEEVIITRKDGSRFKLLSINENKKQGRSPLEDIKCIKADVSMEDIIEAIRYGREDREYKTDTQ